MIELKNIGYEDVEKSIGATEFANIIEFEDAGDRSTFETFTDKKLNTEKHQDKEFTPGQVWSLKHNGDEILIVAGVVPESGAVYVVVELDDGYIGLPLSSRAACETVDKLVQSESEYLGQFVGMFEEWKENYNPQQNSLFDTKLQTLFKSYLLDGSQIAAT